MITKEVLDVLPESIQKEILKQNNLEKLQEIRIKINKPLILYAARKEVVCSYKVSLEDMRIIIKKISNYSIYAFEQEIKQGFITIHGGHRIGICGSCVIENNKVKIIKNFSSLNIRICREIIGCSNKLMPFIVNNKNMDNIIIISPPKCGKTTLIRDITRNLSEGFKVGDINIPGKKVCVIDERSEIGGCSEGIPQMRLGSRTDVLDNCPKSCGIMMAIRSMAPDVIVCDEIGTYDDVKSILMAMNSGVKLVTTIHGYGIEDIYNRSVFKDALDNEVFKKAIVLSGLKGVGTIEYIYDFKRKNIIWRG